MAASLVGYAATHSSYGDRKGYTIDNVISYATVQCRSGVTNRDYRWNLAGGLVAATNTAGHAPSITNCTFAGSIPMYANSDQTVTGCGYGSGGIIGLIYQSGSSMSIQNCLNTGTVNARCYAGGIVGHDASTNVAVDCTISDCINVGDVYARKFHASNDIPNGSLDNLAEYGAFVGSDVGASFKLTNCYNNADIADMVGYNDSTQDNCVNTYTASPAAIVFYLGAQEATEASADGKGRSVRLVGKLTGTKESLANYKAVGFLVSVTYNGSGRLEKTEQTTVYSSLLLQGGNGELDSDYSTLTDGFYFAAVFENIPVAFGDATFTVTPYYVDNNDNTVYGDTGYNIINIADGTVAHITVKCACLHSMVIIRRIFFATNVSVSLKDLKYCIISLH